MTENERRHFEVVLEQILHEVKTVAEGHGTLDQKIERYHKEAKEDHRTMMDLLKFSHDEHDKKIDGVRTELKEEIQAVHTELKETREELSAKIEVVGNKVNGEAREGALGHKVDGHEERIKRLERKAA